MVLLRFIRELRNKRFSIAIVPSTVSTSFTSDFLAYLSGARCRIGAGSLSGVENRSAFLFTIPERLDWAPEPDRHQTLRNIDNARSLGLVYDDLTLEMTLSNSEEEGGRSYVREVKKGQRRAIGFHPGAGKVPNRWPAECFSALINELVPEFDAAAVVTCGPMDIDQVRAVEKGLDFPYHLIENQEIRRVASILKSLDLVITNDTGIMHVAAAVGVPVLSLFGPTSPQQWAPQGNRNRYIQGRDGDIRTIPVERVLETARSMICS